MSALASIAAFAGLGLEPRRAMWRASGLLQEAANSAIEADAIAGVADGHSIPGTLSDRFFSHADTRLLEALAKAREAVKILEQMTGDAA